LGAYPCNGRWAVRTRHGREYWNTWVCT
jgi:hypothetical protein